MFVCKDCKKEFQEKVDYCDCGNNVFEEVADAPAVQESDTPAINTETFSPSPVLPVSLMSVTVFSICCIFSLCFILFLGPEPAKRVEKPVTSQKTVVKDIPPIENIWDDTPKYNFSYDANADWNLYKEGLRNTLISMLDTRYIEGAGSCDVQFILDKHGNLKKKKLYQNTANKPLITAAKKMLSAVKGYNPPPKSYDGSPITFEVRTNPDDTYSLIYKN